MFLKPYKIKSNVQLKSSDVKQLRQRLETTYPNVTAEELTKLFPQKSLNVSLIKLITHKGFLSSVFCIEKLPMFFEYESENNVTLLAPTIYALWDLPNLVPYFTTTFGVLPKLLNGANLFLKGVEPQSTGVDMYGNYKRGQLIAINLTSNKSAVGVGVLSNSSYDLYRIGHGSAVDLLHVFGDKLWAHEPTLAKQIPNTKTRTFTDDDFPSLDAAKVAHKTSNNVPTECETAVQEISRKLVEATKLAEQTTVDDDDDDDDDDGVENVANINDVVAEKNVEKCVQQTPEELLKIAFLTALKNHGKSLQLPLLTSNFYRLYVITEAAQPIDIKKTKYKKLSNFLNEMVKEGFLTTFEESKGIDKITSIDFKHPELENFIVDFKQPVANDPDAEQDVPLFHSELIEMYIVSDATAPFFTKLNYKRGEGIPVTLIKKVVREYLNTQNFSIVDPVNKIYQLDDTLQQICGCTQASLSRIKDIIISQMDKQFQMCKIKDKSMNKPPIQLSLANRSGNKKVTLVANIEFYGIIINEFIKLCKQGAAASTTIVKVPPNYQREQLQIQGNQIRFVFNLLTETYKVPAKSIIGLELAKDAKKHKKKK